MINEATLNTRTRPKYQIPVIFQPVTPAMISDNSPNPDTRIFRKSNVGLSDAEKDRLDSDNLKNYSKIDTDLLGTSEQDNDRDGKDGKGGGGDEDEDGFSIFKIFKIVPIGISVLAKAPTLASGFADLVEGTTIGLINASMSSLDLFTSTFSFSIQGFKFMFILLICMVENLSNLNACIVFYLVDLIAILVFLILFSILKLVDEIFMIRLTGVSLVELIMMAAEPIVAFDDYIHSISGYHLIHYPDYIIKRCYTCSVKLNTERTAETGSRLSDVITGVIPRRMGEPIDKLFSAFTKFGSIFDL